MRRNTLLFASVVYILTNLIGVAAADPPGLGKKDKFTPKKFPMLQNDILPKIKSLFPKIDVTPNKIRIYRVEIFGEVLEDNGSYSAFSASLDADENTSSTSTGTGAILAGTGPTTNPTAACTQFLAIEGIGSSQLNYWCSKASTQKQRDTYLSISSAYPPIYWYTYTFGCSDADKAEMPSAVKATCP